MIGRHGTATSAGELGRAVVAGQERPERDQQRDHGQRGARLERQVGGRQRHRGADHAAEGPGAVERRQDRPPVAVLEGDRLHVGAGVDDAQAEAVERDAADVEAHRRGQAEGGHRRPRRRAGRRAAAARCPCASRAPRRPRSRLRRAGSSSAGSATAGRRRCPTVLELRQPGGQAEEDQALGEEAGRDGQRGSVRCPWARMVARPGSTVGRFGENACRGAGTARRFPEHDGPRGR